MGDGRLNSESAIRLMLSSSELLMVQVDSQFISTHNRNVAKLPLGSSQDSVVFVKICQTKLNFIPGRDRKNLKSTVYLVMSFLYCVYL